MSNLDSRRVNTRSDRRLWFFHRFEEPVPAEFYRWASRLRMLILLLFLTVNFAAGFDPESIGYRHDFYWIGMAVNTPIVLADIFLNLIMWRGRFSVPALRRMNIASLLLEVTSTSLLLWAHGTTSSHVLMFGIFLVFLYRIGFDFTTGLVAVLSLLATHWGLLIAEGAGWLSSQPLFVQSEQHTYFFQRELGIMVIVSVFLITSFVAADWSVARLRNKDAAIRILRATLAASEPGRMGRHTGQTLKETYSVGKLISSGGMGEVYRGHHLRTKRPVAVKILHPYLMDDEMLLRRFRREAEITGQLGSPNIVEVLDVDREDELAFLVLELLDGQDLKSRIDEEGALSPRFVDSIVEQVSAGLSVAHQAGVVHRDLKPENIFLCSAKSGGRVKILDFGVSKIHGNATALTQEVALLGTPDFMSPEQAIGQTSEIDARTDVFALGCITYNMLTGRRPFEATSIPALLRRICDEEPAPVSRWRNDLPEDVDHVLAIALAKRLEERYATVAELHADLSAALAGKLDEAVVERASRLQRGSLQTTSVVGDATVSAAADTIVAASRTDDAASRG